MARKRIYVAGKLNDMAVAYIKNVRGMCIEADSIRKMGYSVFVPCLDVLMGLIAGDYDYNDYFENNQPWLAASDAVYVCADSEESKGTKKEIEYAEKLGIPVIYDKKDLP